MTATNPPRFDAVRLPTWRIVPTRFPPVSLFDKVATFEQFDSLYEFESLTNDRLLEEVGNLAQILPEDRVFGPGTTPIMAAFTHVREEGARFTDPGTAAWYAGLELETAVDETRYWRGRMLADNSAVAGEYDMRVYVADLTAVLDDIRNWPGLPAAVYDRDDHSAGQAFARARRAEFSDGIVYESVRRAGGSCIVAFRPRLLANCRQERTLAYRFDGTTVVDVYEKRSFP